MKPETTNTLVSDEQAFSDEAPFSRNIDSDHFKLNYLRDIYEAELTKLRSERDELVVALRLLEPHFRTLRHAVTSVAHPDEVAVERATKNATMVLSQHKPE